MPSCPVLAGDGAMFAMLDCAGIRGMGDERTRRHLRAAYHGLAQRLPIGGLLKCLQVHALFNNSPSGGRVQPKPIDCRGHHQVALNIRAKDERGFTNLAESNLLVEGDGPCVVLPHTKPDR